MTREALREITYVARAFDEMLNRAPNRYAPYVGASAFATKAGIHASALAKTRAPTSTSRPTVWATRAPY